LNVKVMVADAVIQATGLVKTYGEVEAVRGIDLEVRAGEIFGFLGPNGAGKSTTISILCTLLRPTAGTARVAGIDVVHDPARVRQRIGLVFQDPSLDDQLTGRENLEFHAFIYSVPSSERRRRIDEMLALLQLSDRAGSQVKTYSGGMKRRLEIGNKTPPGDPPRHAAPASDPLSRRADARPRSTDKADHLDACQ